MSEQEPQVGGIAAEALRQIIDRVERLREEVKGLNADISDVYKQAKATGFDVRVIKEIIKIRAKEPTERDEFEQLLDTYLHAIGMDCATHVQAHED